MAAVSLSIKSSQLSSRHITQPVKSINYKKYADLIGNTPLIDITSLANPRVAGVKVLGKAEFLNPGFSMKDRIVRSILNAAE
jgi:cystathionine beta-synthase